MRRRCVDCVAVTVAALMLAVVAPGPSRAEVIDFGTASGSLPYSEDGLTFTKVNPASPMSIGGFDGDAELGAGTNFTPIHVRATGAGPFDLDTFDVEGLYRAWRLESSSGAVFNIPMTGTFDLRATSGWQGIAWFDIIHNPAEANGTITLDNVAVTFVPEPAAAAALLAGLAAVALRRRRRHDGGR